MLIQRYAERIDSILLPAQGISPFPSVDERVEWESVPELLSEPVVKEAEKYRGYDWKALSALNFMESCRMNDDNAQRLEVSGKRSVLRTLILAECFEGKGRFINDIANGIWSICEESSWAVPANSYMHRCWPDPLPDVSDPVIDLASSGTAALLTWACHLLGPVLDDVSVNLCKRIKHEINCRIMKPFLDNDDIWWMGFTRMVNPRMKVLHPINNWNPFCTSNCLLTFLVLESNWKKRRDGVIKSMRITDVYLDNYSGDGGCDEGISYWMMGPAGLFDILEMLYFYSDGVIDLYEEPLIKDIGRYFYRAYIGKNNFVNFADASCKLGVCNDLAYRYGKRIRDDALMSIGKDLILKEIKECGSKEENSDGRKPGSLMHELPMLFNYGRISEEGNENYYLRDIWLKDLQVMAAREREGSCEGWYIAAKGGHNAESHNHNDIGQFIVYYNASPVLVDPGVEKYSGRTFSDERYDIWTMQSSYHNLPEINGLKQHEGRQYKASGVNYNSSDEAAVLSMDISKAYPEDAGISCWKRVLKLNRSGRGNIEITDDFVLNELSENVRLNLITPCRPECDGKGKITVITGDGSDISVEFDRNKLEYSCESIAVNDVGMEAQWGKLLYRIILKTRQKVKKDTWRLKISVN